jgi:hypothetical protein
MLRAPIIKDRRRSALHGCGERRSAMLTRLRPSPALIVASFALIVAISGTAYAAATINGRSIEDHTIAGRKMINDTLTGTQIKESRLGTVPRAAHASNSGTVGGITVRKVFYAPSTASPTSVNILRIGGLTLAASCNSGTVAIIVTTSVNNTHLSSQMFNSGGGGQADGLHHTDFDSTGLDDLTDQNLWGETSFTYVRPDHTTVSGELSFDSSNVIGGNIFNHKAACLVSGFAISSTSS